MDGLLILRNFDALDLFEFFDAALHLLRLRRRRAEAIDESLQLLDAVSLVLIRGNEIRAALFFLAQVRFVVAAVELHPLVPDLDSAIDRDIQKIAIVRNQQIRERVIREIGFEPVAGFEIQVIRRLIQQQHVRLGQQQLRERDAHLPAAREMFGAPRPVFLLEPEPVKHRAHLRLNRVAISIAKFRIDVVQTIGCGFVFGARWVELAETVVERLQLLLHFMKIGEHAHAFGENRAAGKRQAILRKIALRDAFLRGHRAVVERLHPAQNLQQRRLARAVSADQTRALFRRDEPVAILEEKFVAETFSGAGQLDHLQKWPQMNADERR